MYLYLVIQVTTANTIISGLSSSVFICIYIGPLTSIHMCTSSPTIKWESGLGCAGDPGSYEDVTYPKHRHSSLPKQARENQRTLQLYSSVIDLDSDRRPLRVSYSGCLLCLRDELNAENTFQYIILSMTHKRSIYIYIYMLQNHV